MRAPLLIALLLLGAAPAWAAEEPSGCDKFKWPIERERAALTAPERIKLVSRSELTALPSTGITLALLAPETRAEGRDLCRVCEYQSYAEGRSIYRQPVRRRLD
jgi:hypothetical protein